jgi:hypothetical protein
MSRWLEAGAATGFSAAVSDHWWHMWCCGWGLKEAHDQGLPALVTLLSSSGSILLCCALLCLGADDAGMATGMPA